MQSMPPPETYKSEIRSQSTMCQVHTGSYVSLLAPGKTDYTACHPRETTTHIFVNCMLGYDADMMTVEYCRGFQ